LPKQSTLVLQLGEQLFVSRLQVPPHGQCASAKHSTHVELWQIGLAGLHEIKHPTSLLHVSVVESHVPEPHCSSLVHATQVAVAAVCPLQ